MARGLNLSAFLHYLASVDLDHTEQHLPALNELSKELGLSVSVLREQLEVARALGLVEVRPRTGIRRLPYSFLPAVQQSVGYALRRSPAYFEDFVDLRNHLESAYWDEVVHLLRPEDLNELKSLLGRAWSKLRGHPVQIPHEEHRLLHRVIYRRLENPYVQGILEAYWEAYEEVGLNLYTDFKYLEEVWTYHQRMVDALCVGDFDSGYRALVAHKDLLHNRQTASLLPTPE